MDERADSIDILEPLFRNDIASDIEKILHKMSEPYKQVFLLRHYGELSYEDISACIASRGGKEVDRKSY